MAMDTSIYLHSKDSICRRSQLAPLPLGAAAARLSHPTGASGGGAEGERFPLVGQSEAGATS
jgi:hypothetical protein